MRSHLAVGAALLIVVLLGDALLIIYGRGRGINVPAVVTFSLLLCSLALGFLSKEMMRHFHE
jgi:hypothetical protein